MAILSCGAFSGCSRTQGPATNAYLRRVESISLALSTEVRRLPKITPPTRPLLSPRPTNQERRGYVIAIRGYNAAEIRNYADIIERCRVLSELDAKAQTQFSAVRAAGVDPSVVQLVSMREHALGQRRQLFIEIGRLAQLNRDALVRRQSSDALDDLVTSIFVGAVKGLGAGGADGAVMGGLLGALKEGGRLASARQVERQKITDQLDRLTATATQLQRDVVEYQTARSQEITAVQMKFPDQDWGFLTAPAGGVEGH